MARFRDDESLLLRSAESLGRMIGSLQRQLEIATGRLTSSKPSGSGRKHAAAKSSSQKAKSGATTRGRAQKNSASGDARKRLAARKSAKKR